MYFRQVVTILRAVIPVCLVPSNGSDCIVGFRRRGSTFSSLLKITLQNLALCPHAESPDNQINVSPINKGEEHMPNKHKQNPQRTEKYLPIEDYGIIGDLHTVALVGKNGSIDWCCVPSFDAPSIFAALLDAEKGGFFSIAPQDTPELRQN